MSQRDRKTIVYTGFPIRTQVYASSSIGIQETRVMFLTEYITFAYISPSIFSTHAYIFIYTQEIAVNDISAISRRRRIFLYVFVFSFFFYERTLIIHTLCYSLLCCMVSRFLSVFNDGSHHFINVAKSFMIMCLSSRYIIYIHCVTSFFHHHYIVTILLLETVVVYLYPRGIRPRARDL